MWIVETLKRRSLFLLERNQRCWVWGFSGGTGQVGTSDSTRSLCVPLGTRALPCHVTLGRDCGESCPAHSSKCWWLVQELWSSAAHDSLKASLLCVTCCSATLLTVVLYWVQWNTHFLSQSRKKFVTCLVSVSAQGWAWRAYFGSTKCAGDCLLSLLAPHDDFSSSCFIEEEESV